MPANSALPAANPRGGDPPKRFEMDPKPGLSASTVLLIVQSAMDGAPPSEPVLRALGALGCAALPGSAQHYDLQLAVGFERPLRELAEACSRAGGSAWLVARPPPADDSGPYRRLRDRSGEFGTKLAAWKYEDGGFPPLQPGDMVQL